MNSQTARTILLAGLFIGCIGLAVPQVTQPLEAWLFDNPRELTQVRPLEKQALLLKQKHAAQQAGFIAANHESSSANQRQDAELLSLPVNQPTRRNFAFGYEEEPISQEPSRKYDVQPSSLAQPDAKPPTELVRWQHTLEQLGARYVVVETQGDRFQCRCLMPIDTDSPYEKAFAAENLDPAQAMQAVVEQVRMWQAQKAERWEQQKIRELRR